MLRPRRDGRQARRTEQNRHVRPEYAADGASLAYVSAPAGDALSGRDCLVVSGPALWRGRAQSKLVRPNTPAMPPSATPHIAQRRATSDASVPRRYGEDDFDSLGAYTPLPDAVHSGLHSLRLEYFPGPDGFIRWYFDGNLGFEVLNTSLGRYAERPVRPTAGVHEEGDGNSKDKELELRKRLIPEEPMYLIISVSCSEHEPCTNHCKD